MESDSPSEKSSGPLDVAAEKTRRRWLNITLAVGLIIAGVGFYVETRRALEGHLPAWVYVVEWPLLGFVGFRIWQRLVREDNSASVSDSDSDEVIQESWKDFSARSRSENPPTREPK